MFIRPTRTAKRPFHTHDIEAIAKKASSLRPPTHNTVKLPTRPALTPGKGS